MYRIRFHGRGGQGIKTAGRVLGTAFFLEGFTVQDSPRYGAERRGAPIVAYVRAAQRPIDERGVIQHPDLVVVVDETLVQVVAAEVLTGVTPRTVLLMTSRDDAEIWRHRLSFAGAVLTLPPRATGRGTASPCREHGVRGRGGAAPRRNLARLARARGP